MKHLALLFSVFFLFSFEFPEYLNLHIKKATYKAPTGDFVLEHFSYKRFGVLEKIKEKHLEGTWYPENREMIFEDGSSIYLPEFWSQLKSAKMKNVKFKIGKSGLTVSWDKISWPLIPDPRGLDNLLFKCPKAGKDQNEQMKYCIKGPSVFKFDSFDFTPGEVYSEKGVIFPEKITEVTSSLKNGDFEMDFRSDSWLPIWGKITAKLSMTNDDLLQIKMIAFKVGGVDFKDYFLERLKNELEDNSIEVDPPFIRLKI